MTYRETRKNFWTKKLADAYKVGAIFNNMMKEKNQIDYLVETVNDTLDINDIPKSFSVAVDFLKEEKAIKDVQGVVLEKVYGELITSMLFKL